MSGFIDGLKQSQGDKMRIKNAIRFGSIALMCLSVIFGIHLVYQYNLLDRAFHNQEDFVPTRIFSDLTRIAPPMLREVVESRLKALQYQKHITPSLDALSFTLHDIDYPKTLLPQNHPTLFAEGKTVELTFDDDTDQGVLVSVVLDGLEVPEIYLEPELVATLSRGADHQVRDLRKFEDIPANLWQAIIAIEDQHYLEHSGLDPKGIARAMIVNIKAMRFKQGGSTITQQLIKNLMVRRGKNLFQKISELFLSLALEVRYSKEQILERYLNEVYLGQIGNQPVHGVSEGARYFYGKSLEELSLGETALLAGLIRGPSYYSPYRFPERAFARQQLVLQKMVEVGYIAQEEAQQAAKEKIEFSPPRTHLNQAPYFSDFVKAEFIRQLDGQLEEEDISSAGFRIYTTLDVYLNDVAQKAVTHGVEQLEERLKLKDLEYAADQRLEGALASVDHRTGFIRALIGGKNYSESTFNRILNMKRQVGSTFKPFVYLTALEKGIATDEFASPSADLNSETTTDQEKRSQIISRLKNYPKKKIEPGLKIFGDPPPYFSKEKQQELSQTVFGPAYPIEDAAWTLHFDHGEKEWSPENYKKEFRGWVDLRTGLAHSINVVAAKLGILVGPENIAKTAKALGIRSDLPVVPSLALGVAELSPVELLNAYATIANRGARHDLTVIREIRDRDGSAIAHFENRVVQVVPQGAADLLIDMLQSVVLEGTARGVISLGFDRPSAGKTGTTSQHRDSWYAGFTPQYTTVSWVGLDKGVTNIESKSEPQESRHRALLTGASGSLPIWTEYMKKAHEMELPAPFENSENLTSIRIDRRTGQRARFGCISDEVVVEKYIVGHEPDQYTCSEDWPESETESTLDDL